ncbi:hypothetical protein Tco_0652718 [Tanacetum coccineum]|uniref:Transposase (Putative), gypsy type n=1 Tax=Tanacetum coccineum TaxID=301880 RepID=A0ABQ4WYF5_9ASTR
MSSIYDVKSTLTQTALNTFCQKYHIPDIVHPELLGPNQNIRNSPVDPSPTAAEYSAKACDFLVAHPAPFRKFPKPFLCLVGLIRYYDLDRNVYPTFLTSIGEEMGLFAFIHHADPTEVRIGENQIEEGQVGSVVRVDHGDQNDNIENVGHGDLNEERGDAAADKPKGRRKKRRATGGASGSNHPPKKLREDHGNSGNVSASTGGKSLVEIPGLLERSTLNMEAGVAAMATVSFVTSSVTPTAEHEGGGDTDLISGPNLRTQRPSERSSVSLPPVMTAAVTTTVIVGVSSALALGTGVELEMDSETLRQIYVPKWNVVNESVLDDPDVCRSVVDQLAPPGLFSQLRDIDYDQLFVEFNVGAARQTCLGAEVRMRSEHNLRERKRFERRCARQVDLLKEREVEIANLKAQLSLKEAEATEVIRLRSQVSVVEAAEAARVSELNSLKERNIALEKEKNTLEGQVATLESAVVTKDTELASLNAQTAKLTQDLSSLQLSCDELSIKAASLESQRDGLIDRVSSLETTCSGIRDQV